MGGGRKPTYKHRTVFSSEMCVQGMCALSEKDVGRRVAVCPKLSENSCGMPSLRLTPLLTPSSFCSWSYRPPNRSRCPGGGGGETVACALLAGPGALGSSLPTPHSALLCGSSLTNRSSRVSRVLRSRRPELPWWRVRVPRGSPRVRRHSPDHCMSPGGGKSSTKSREEPRWPRRP